MSDRPDHEPPRSAGPPPAFDEFQVVLLRRPADRPDFDEATTARLLGYHLGHFANASEAGALKAAGPLSDQADESMRGISIYQVSSAEEARRIAEQDPAVRAGMFEVEVVTWHLAKGAMTFPGVPLTGPPRE